jgi:uncharacterized protein YjbI with pentapeptide repeats
MKIIKPDHLSLLYATFPRLPGIPPTDDAHGLSLALLAGFPLNHDASEALLPENVIWQRIQEALPADEILDQGLPKPRAEFLVYGACCSRNPVRGREIQVQVGTLRKGLHVFGPRFWRAHGLTTPRPFTRIPVTWRQAYGGIGHALNPLGLGHARLHRGVHPLPLVEYPGHLAAFPRQKVPAASLTAIPAQWPQRRRYLGTVDAGWLEKHWPGLPGDCDPEYACIAPRDQRFSGFLHGGEKIAIQGMHPRLEHLRGAIPRMRARLFLQRGTGAAPACQEVACRMETVWLFPDSQTGIVLFRGVAATLDEECADIAVLQAGIEPLDQPPRPLDYYSQERERVMGRTPAGADLDDLHPVADPSHGVDQLPVSGSMMGAKASMAGMAAGGIGVVAAQGGGGEQSPLHDLARTIQDDVSRHLDGIGLTPEQADTFLARAAGHDADLGEQGASSDDLLQHLQETASAIEAETSALLARHGLTPEDAEQLLARHADAAQVPEEQYMEGLRHMAEREDLPQDVRAGLRDTMQGFTGVQTALAALALKFSKATASPSAHDPNQSAQGHPKAPEGQTPVVHGPLSTGQALERHAGGMGLAHCDLRQCDLSGHDLSGADLRGAILDGVAWPGVNLAGADLSRAMISRADLRGADLTGANLDRAVLDQARLDSVTATGCFARRAQMQAVNLSGADLSQADLTAADCTRANLTRANLAAVQGQDLRLGSAVLQDADFSAAILPGARADAMTNGTGANFQGADLRNARWSGARLRGANFTAANLDGADLCKADLRQANLLGASARHARLIRADLRQANLVGLNLLQGSLRHADCRQACIQDANLFGVDLYKCTLDPRTLKKVNLDRTVLRPGLLENAA